MNRSPALALVVLLALTGCAGSPTATPTVSPAPPSSQPTLEPSPSATPTPTQTALDDLIVTPQGIETVTIGSPVPSEPAATAVVSYDDDRCTVFGAVGEPFVGLWTPNYPATDEYTDGPGAFTVRTQGAVEDGAVTRIWVWSPKITTETGIHMGSTREEVEAAYPDPSYLVHEYATDIYVIDEGAGRMVIEVVREAAGGVTEADIDKVYMLGVQPKSEKVVSFANVNGTAGCGE